MFKMFKVLILKTAFIFFFITASMATAADEADIIDVLGSDPSLHSAYDLYAEELAQEQKRIAQEHAQALYRYGYVEGHQKEQHFGLNNSSKIEELRKDGTQKGWDDFMPTGVADHLAAVDFLNKAIPPFDCLGRAIPPFSLDVDKNVEEKVVGNISDLLTIRSHSVRDANEKERAIILTGTAHEALDLCARENKENLKAKLSFGFWNSRFINQHGERAKDKAIEQTITTRAVAAVIVALTVYVEQTDFECELAALFQAAKMEKEKGQNLLKEISEIDAVRKIVGYRLWGAAEAGNTTSLYTLGQVLTDPEMRRLWGFVEDNAKTKDCFMQAATQGHVGAMYETGRWAEEKAETKKWFKQAADLRHPGAMYELTHFNEENKSEWLPKAANLGHVDAINDLAGLLLAEGKKADAIEWYKKVANNEQVESRKRAAAMVKLAEIYKENKDQEAQTIHWYQKAAEIGEVDAILQLAEASVSEKDYKTAKKWFLKAAEQQKEEAIIWMVGTSLFEKDTQAAMEFCSQAAHHLSAINLLKSAIYADESMGYFDEGKAVDYYRQIAQYFYIPVEGTVNLDNVSLVKNYVEAILSKCEQGKNIIAWFQAALAKAKIAYEKNSVPDFSGFGFNIHSSFLPEQVILPFGSIDL